MALWSGLFRGRGAAAAVEKSSAGAPTYGAIPPLGSVPSATGLLVSQSTAMTVSAVYACVTIRSEDVARCTPTMYRVKDDGGREKVKPNDHPVARLLVRPNRIQTWFEFSQQMEAGLALRGNAYAAILRDRRGQPTELIAINPDAVLVLEAVDGSIFYNVNRIGLFQISVLRDLPVAIPAEDIFHLRGLSFNMLAGASTIGLARDAVGLAMALEQQAARFVGNGARPSGVLKAKGKLTVEAAQRLKASWNAFVSGVSNVGTTAVLEEGMEWQQLQLTAADLDFIKQRELQIAEVARFYRMPLSKLGLGDAQKAGQFAQTQQEYVADAIMPSLERWETKFAQTFDLDLQGYEVDMDENRLLRADVQTRYNNARIGLLSGFLSPNEVRMSEGLGPVPDGDTVMRPLNMAALGSDATGTAPDGAGKPRDGELPADATDGAAPKGEEE
ncbi:phage portal protein [Azospirillum sp. TSO5]|uniref:phage portal protein n=1 Tax=Azospirillum sp. TSO5 TaxID=716760 RepID=UPI000D621BAD|nr:phage portal protein [Azospirillum sp. TSO5]PWC96957.1 hypothetical protein TSO5_05870 [Azospirillum sp. TSO5]